MLDVWGWEEEGTVQSEDRIVKNSASLIHLITYTEEGVINMNVIPYLCPSLAAWILFLNCTPLHPAYEVCTPLLMIQGHDSNTAYCRVLLQKVRYIRLPTFAPNDLRLYGLK